MSFLEPLIKAVDSVVVTDDTFNFLNYTGRKAYYSQGYYGQGIIGAVIDTGCKTSHKEFKDSSNVTRLAGYKSFCDYTEGGIDDDNGHGTHVSGSIFGKTCGILPQAKMLIIKVLDGSGDNTIANIIAGFEYAAKWRDTSGNPVDFVSSSLSIPASSMNDSEITRFHNAIKALVTANIPVFVSSGNTGTDSSVRYPSFFDEVITVGAVSIDKQLAYFSTRSDAVDICQIGVNVVSADYSDLSGYCLKSGTSMSTPISAGTAGLLMCKYKALFNKRIPEQVLYNMVKMNTLDLGWMGIDKEFGAGFFTLEPKPVIKIIMKIGAKDFTVNGVAKQFDTAPFATDGRTYVPIRFISEELGDTVDWNSVDKVTITITR